MPGGGQARGQRVTARGGLSGPGEKKVHTRVKGPRQTSERNGNGEVGVFCRRAQPVVPLPDLGLSWRRLQRAVWTH